MSAFAGGGSSQQGQLTVFIGNLPFECTQGDIDALFQGLNVEQVRLIHDREEGTFKGFGYVEFSDEESLNTALGYNNSEWMGRRLRIDLAQPKGQGGGRGGDRGDRGGRGGGFGGRNGGDRNGGDRNGGDRGGGAFSSYGGGAGGSGGHGQRAVPDEPPFTAFVGNIPYETVQGDLEALFDGLSIKDVRIAYDRETGESRGMGYVEFNDKQSLVHALQYNGQPWGNRELRINVADQKGGNRRGGPGGNGGNGGHGGSRGNSRGVGFGGNDGFGAGAGGYNEDRAGSDAFGSSRSRNDRGGDFGHDNSAFGVARRGAGNAAAGAPAEGGFGGARNDELPPEPTAQDEAERPRLKLASRTKKDPPAASASQARSSSIFGAAKPVDVKVPEKAAAVDAKKAEEPAKSN